MKVYQIPSEVEEEFIPPTISFLKLLHKNILPGIIFIYYKDEKIGIDDCHGNFVFSNTYSFCIGKINYKKGILKFSKPLEKDFVKIAYHYVREKA